MNPLIWARKFRFWPKNSDFGPKIRFLLWDIEFCQWPVCSPLCETVDLPFLDPFFYFLYPSNGFQFSIKVDIAEKQKENEICRYNVSGSGTISLQELKIMMEKLGAPQTHLGLKAMIKEVSKMRRMRKG